MKKLFTFGLLALAACVLAATSNADGKKTNFGVKKYTILSVVDRAITQDSSRTDTVKCTVEEDGTQGTWTITATMRTATDPDGDSLTITAIGKAGMAKSLMGATWQSWIRIKYQGKAWAQKDYKTYMSVPDEYTRGLTEKQVPVAGITHLYLESYKTPWRINPVDSSWGQSSDQYCHQEIPIVDQDFEVEATDRPCVETYLFEPNDVSCFGQALGALIQWGTQDLPLTREHIAPLLAVDWECHKRSLEN